MLLLTAELGMPSPVSIPELSWSVKRLCYLGQVWALQMWDWNSHQPSPLTVLLGLMGVVVPQHLEGPMSASEITGPHYPKRSQYRLLFKTTSHTPQCNFPGQMSPCRIIAIDEGEGISNPNITALHFPSPTASQYRDNRSCHQNISGRAEFPHYRSTFIPQVCDFSRWQKYLGREKKKSIPSLGVRYGYLF